MRAARADVLRAAEVLPGHLQCEAAGTTGQDRRLAGRRALSRLEAEGGARSGLTSG